MQPAPKEPLARHALAFVLAGGRGTWLDWELTIGGPSPRFILAASFASSILHSPTP